MEADPEHAAFIVANKMDEAEEPEAVSQECSVAAREEPRALHVHIATRESLSFDAMSPGTAPTSVGGGDEPLDVVEAHAENAPDEVQAVAESAAESAVTPPPSSQPLHATEDVEHAVASEMQGSSSSAAAVGEPVHEMYKQSDDTSKKGDLSPGALSAGTTLTAGECMADATVIADETVAPSLAATHRIADMAVGQTDAIALRNAVARPHDAAGGRLSAGAEAPRLSPASDGAPKFSITPEIAARLSLGTDITGDVTSSHGNSNSSSVHFSPLDLVSAHKAQAHFAHPVERIDEDLPALDVQARVQPMGWSPLASMSASEYFMEGMRNSAQSAAVSGSVAASRSSNSSFNSHGVVLSNHTSLSHGSHMQDSFNSIASHAEVSDIFAQLQHVHPDDLLAMDTHSSMSTYSRQLTGGTDVTATSSTMSCNFGMGHCQKQSTNLSTCANLTSNPSLMSAYSSFAHRSGHPSVPVAPKETPMNSNDDKEQIALCGVQVSQTSSLTTTTDSTQMSAPSEQVKLSPLLADPRPQALQTSAAFAWAVNPQLEPASSTTLPLASSTWQDPTPEPSQAADSGRDSVAQAHNASDTVDAPPRPPSQAAIDSAAARLAGTTSANAAVPTAGAAAGARMQASMMGHASSRSMPDSLAAAGLPHAGKGARIRQSPQPANIAEAVAQTLQLLSVNEGAAVAAPRRSMGTAGSIGHAQHGMVDETEEETCPHSRMAASLSYPCHLGNVHGVGGVNPAFASTSGPHVPKLGSKAKSNTVPAVMGMGMSNAQHSAALHSTAGGNSGYQPPEDRTLFFAEVSRNAREEDITAVFSRFGTVEQVNLFRTSRTAPLTRGCGLVAMGSIKEAVNAINGLNDAVVWPGRRSPMAVKWMDVELQRSRREEYLKCILTGQRPPTRGERDGGPGPPPGVAPDSFKLFVGNLSTEETEETLMPFFSTCGKVVELTITRGRMRNMSKGSAFVWYSMGQESVLAMKMLNGLMLPGMNVPLVVRPAVTTNPPGSAHAPPPLHQAQGSIRPAHMPIEPQPIDPSRDRAAAVNGPNMRALHMSGPHSTPSLRPPPSHVAAHHSITGGAMPRAGLPGSNPAHLFMPPSLNRAALSHPLHPHAGSVHLARPPQDTASHLHAHTMNTVAAPGMRPSLPTHALSAGITSYPPQGIAPSVLSGHDVAAVLPGMHSLGTHCTDSAHSIASAHGAASGQYTGLMPVNAHTRAALGLPHVVQPSPTMLLAASALGGVDGVVAPSAQGGEGMLHGRHTMRSVPGAAGAPAPGLPHDTGALYAVLGEQGRVVAGAALGTPAAKELGGAHAGQGGAGLPGMSEPGVDAAGNSAAGAASILTQRGGWPHGLGQG